MPPHVPELIGEVVHDGTQLAQLDSPLVQLRLKVEGEEVMLQGGDKVGKGVQGKLV